MDSPQSDDALPLAIRAAVQPLTVLNRIAEHALELIAAADGVVVELLDESGAELTYVSAGGAMAPHVGITLRADNSLSGLAITSRRTLRCDDVATDPRVNLAACRRVGVSSMICVPLVSGLRPVGVLKVSARHAMAFEDADEQVLNDIALFSSTLIEATMTLAAATEEFLVAPTTGSAVASSTSAFVANVLQPGLAGSVESQRYIEQVLRDQAFSCAFQPIVDLSTGSLVGVEALSRFHAIPERPPDVWFREAHRCGLGIDLELAAVTSALRALASLPDEVFVAVNVGPAALVDPRLHELVAEHPGRVVVELTEHDLIVDTTQVVDALRALEGLGAQVAVDDTGAGYSSLSRLLRLRPQVIKIDREFVAGVADDPVRQAVVTGLVHVARDLGAAVIGEGVESAADIAGLTQLGVMLGQGYEIARPAPLTTIRDLYAEIAVGPVRAGRRSIPWTRSRQGPAMGRGPVVFPGSREARG